MQCDGLLTVSFHHAVCFINAVSFSLSTHLSVIASSVFLVLLASIVCLAVCFLSLPATVSGAVLCRLVLCNFVT